ncbi:hypothetical protein [Chryseobacterium sp. JAH]|uniref:hypothetical protein n=1 Tax=Chryseobacterium sp. JAH TaxID=1742858 RepID=UPI00074114C0|nr:hypothetical protein [Chryseobacterium sp. JAH]KUJ52249.1 hypothetical protein AR685_04305 [Chryseobacterium sp. JAH]
MIKKYALKIFLFCILLSMQSCQHILDQAEEQRAQENFTSEFMGYYSGNYTGGMSGSLTVNVKRCKCRSN